MPKYNSSQILQICLIITSSIVLLLSRSFAHPFFFTNPKGSIIEYSRVDLFWVSVKASLQRAEWSLFSTRSASNCLEQRLLGTALLLTIYVCCQCESMLCFVHCKKQNSYLTEAFISN